MSTTARRFINVRSCTFGALVVNTIREISYSDEAPVLTDQGDDDPVDTYMALGGRSISGSISLGDPVQAAALRDLAAATLTFQGNPGDAGSTPGAGTALNVAITNVRFFSNAPTQGHNRLSGSSLRFRAYSPTGAEPVTVTLV